MPHGPPQHDESARSPAQEGGLLTRMLRPQVLRYLLVGGLLFALDTAVFLSLVKGLDLDVRLAQLASRTVGAAAGCVGHRAFTFRQQGKVAARSLTAQGTGYLTVTLLNIGISPFVVQAATWAIPFSLVLAKVAAEVFLVVETFLLLRIVFRQEERR